MSDGLSFQFVRFAVVAMLTVGIGLIVLTGGV